MYDEQAFRDDFKKANEKVHKVEDQWHYKYLTKHGYKPIDKTGVGFVRSYRYQKEGHVIRCVTGVNADYWEDKDNNGFGYWLDLESHLKKLSTECASIQVCNECAHTHEEKVS